MVNNELVTMFVQKDERLKNERPKNFHVTTHTNGKTKKCKDAQLHKHKIS